MAPIYDPNSSGKKPPSHSGSGNRERGSDHRRGGAPEKKGPAPRSEHREPRPPERRTESEAPNSRVFTPPKLDAETRSPIKGFPEKSWVDAHCHLADPRFQHDLDKVITLAKQAGVKKFVQGGVSPDEWNRQLDLKELYPDNIIPVFGIHPWWVATSDSASIDVSMAALETLAFLASAIGETGLDKAKERGTLTTWDLQKTAFRLHLELANQLKKPVVLHIVHAHPEAIQILEATPPKHGGIVHSFSESAEIAKRYVDLGLCLSVSGVVCREGFDTLKKAIPGIPDRALLIETDAPDQGPDGSSLRNEPVNLLRVAETVGQLRGTTLEDILDLATKNANRIFK